MPDQIELIAHRLAKASSDEERLRILDEQTSVREFWKNRPSLLSEGEVIWKQLAVIGEADRFLEEGQSREQLNEFIEKLLPVDRFYREIGGLVGYTAKIEELLREKEGEPLAASYHSPFFFPIEEETDEVKEAISWGIDAMDQLAEIYPLGGAADRLHLVDEETGAELPAAKLKFAGKTLLERLILDLQAREALYFQKHGKQLITPIAIMTSLEKKNHAHVLEICRSNNWFGRGEDSFRFFTQPLVPTVNEKGQWCKLGPLNPLMKPGGHGAIWKLAKDAGIFDWFQSLGRKKALVRQINNPLAGLDYGLLAFVGVGCRQNKDFGFASCPRLLQAAEGVNVLVERKKGDKAEVVLTNIEYCDFAKFGIEDLPLKAGEPYSRFSSNTNILFVDLFAVQKAVEKCPYPGLLINLKKGSYVTDEKERKEELIGRLESTMQNIADVFVEEKPFAASLAPTQTFVTYNRRHKTISTAKKGYLPGKPLLETPENCFYDLLTAHRELLEKNCHFQLPPQRTIEEMLVQGPELLFLYHPALGPLYSTIAQKMNRGKLGVGSELLLEIGAFQAKNLNVQGSLQVKADQIFGPVAQNVLCYSDRVGRCSLENVMIENRGIDWSRSAPFWKMNLHRLETVQIVLKGNSSFVAKDIHFKGSHTFVVEDGMEMLVLENERNVVIKER